MSDVFVCISFVRLRMRVDLIQPLAAINNQRCLFATAFTDAQFAADVYIG